MAAFDSYARLGIVTKRSVAIAASILAISLVVWFYLGVSDVWLQKICAIPNKQYLSLIVNKYVDRHIGDIEGYFIDTITNNHGYNYEPNNVRGSGLIYFYRAQHHYKEYKRDRANNIIPAMAMIDNAILRDNDNAWNYIFKAFLLEKAGDFGLAERFLLEGIGKRRILPYKREACASLSRFLVRSGLLTEYNLAVFFEPSIIELDFDDDFLKYIVNRFQYIITNPTSGVETRQRVAVLISMLSEKDDRVFDDAEASSRIHFCKLRNKLVTGGYMKGATVDCRDILKSSYELISILKRIRAADGSYVELRKTGFWKTALIIGK